MWGRTHRLRRRLGSSSENGASVSHLRLAASWYRHSRMVSHGWATRHPSPLAQIDWRYPKNSWSSL